MFHRNGFQKMLLTEWRRAVTEIFDWNADLMKMKQSSCKIFICDGAEVFITRKIRLARSEIVELRCSLPCWLNLLFLRAFLFPFNLNQKFPFEANNFRNPFHRSSHKSSAWTTDLMKCPITSHKRSRFSKFLFWNGMVSIKIFPCNLPSDRRDDESRM